MRHKNSVLYEVFLNNRWIETSSVTSLRKTTIEALSNRPTLLYTIKAILEKIRLVTIFLLSHYTSSLSATYSIMSPGWQSRSLHKSIIVLTFTLLPLYRASTTFGFNPCWRSQNFLCPFLSINSYSF